MSLTYNQSPESILNTNSPVNEEDLKSASNNSLPSAAEETETDSEYCIDDRSLKIREELIEEVKQNLAALGYKNVSDDDLILIDIFRNQCKTMLLAMKGRAPEINYEINQILLLISKLEKSLNLNTHNSIKH